MNSFYSLDELRKIGFRSVGENVSISRKASIYGAESISIGNNVRIDDFCILSGTIDIKNYVHIAAGTFLYAGKAGIEIGNFSTISSRSAVYAVSDDYSGNGMTNPTVPDKLRNVTEKKVTIGEHVIIGTNSTVLPGVTIRNGGSFGAMSLINSSTEPWSIYVGIPCRKIKERSKAILEDQKKFCISENVLKQSGKTKKLLLLGGSAQQVVAIKTAKRMGYYTVLCDYLSDNPGQYAADKFYLVSTTDKQAILEVAKKENVDGVLAYASDPAAPTAAYVAEKMGLPGNPYESVEILCNKDKFRKFLADNGFCTPVAKGYDDVNTAVDDIKNGYFKLPIIVKPVDSSGSKGVYKICSVDEAEEKLNSSMEFSRGKRIIVEEYVEKYGYQIAGDGLSVDGKLVFRCFANDHFNPACVNPFVPVSASFPYVMPEWVHDKVHSEIQRLLMALNMNTSTYNFDIRIDKEYNVYLMEVAPRDGGNYIPQIIRYATGVDLVECSVKAAMGEKISTDGFGKPSGYYAYYAVHSLREGILDTVQFADGIEERHILENHLLKKRGDEIKAFTGANTTLGCLLMKFDSMEQMLDMMDNSEEWITLKLENKDG